MDKSNVRIHSINHLATVNERPFIELTEQITPEESIPIENLHIDIGNEDQITTLLSKLRIYRTDPYVKYNISLYNSTTSQSIASSIATTVAAIHAHDKDFSFDISTTNLDAPQAYLLLRLLLDNIDIISSDGQPGRSPYVANRFKLKDPNKVIHITPRRTHAKHREITSQHIKALLKGQQIRPCESPFSSPVQLIRKKDGKVRFCIDFRQLNDLLINDVYPITRIDDALSMLGNGHFFSSLDIASAYWHIQLHPDDQHYTAFSTPDGLFCWVVLPFGLKNAPAIFARFMDILMSGLKWKNCLVYFDDILVFSTTFASHLDDLAQIFGRLHKFNVKIKLSKCTFTRKRFLYLGHIITPDGLEPNPELVSAITNMPLPKNAKELATFLGMCGYYRKFIKNYSTLTMPLRDKTHQLPFQPFSNEEISLINKLKSILTGPDVMLYHPNYELPFEIHTDASAMGLGAVLCQIINNQERVIQYASRTLTTLEKQNYSSNDLEAIAMVWACDLFRSYVYGQHFILYTDHENLRTFLKNPDPGRQARWVFKLSEYDVDIRHRKAQANANADALSRLPDSDSSLSFSFDLMRLDLVEKSIKKTPLPNLNRIFTNYYPLAHSSSQLCICSWNVNSLRSVIKKGLFFPFLQYYRPDVLCITELRGSAKQLSKLSEFCSQLDSLGYHWRYWFPCSFNVGYSGVATLCTLPPTSVIYGIGAFEADQEGRVITTCFGDLAVVNSYTPCIGMNKQAMSKRISFDTTMIQYIQSLSLPYILWNGDFNVTPTPDDAWDSATNPSRVTIAGSTPEERALFHQILLQTKMVDLYHHTSSSGPRYTFYQSNIHRRHDYGLRLDLSLCNQALLPFISFFSHINFPGSDHIPIFTHLDIKNTIKCNSSGDSPSVCFHCEELPIYFESDTNLLSSILALSLPPSSSIRNYSPNDNPIQYTDITSEVFHQHQLSDPECQSVTKKLDKLHTHYIIIDNILFKKDNNTSFPHRPYVPKSLRSYFLYYFHGLPITGHPGRRRMYAQLKRYYYWPGMYTNVKKWVKCCIACIKRKTPFHMYSVTPRHTQANYPMHMIAIDHRGPLKETSRGNVHLFNVIDIFTKFIWSTPTKTTNADEAASHLQHIFLRFGFPKILISDRGSAFISALFREMMKLTGINHRLTTVYQKQSNSHVERPHRHMNETFTILCNSNKDNWDQLCDILAFSFNISVHPESGYSAFELIFGRSPRIPITLQSSHLPLFETHQEYFSNTTQFLSDAFSKVRQQQQRQRQLITEYIENKKIPRNLMKKPPVYQRGDIIFLYEPNTADPYIRSNHDQRGVKKFLYKWTGPHMVHQQLTPTNYEILHSSRRSMEVVHVNSLVPYDPWNTEELNRLLNEQSPIPVTVSSNLDQYYPPENAFTPGNIILILTDPHAFPSPKGLPFIIAKLLYEPSESEVLVHWYGQYDKKPKVNSKFLPTWVDPKDNKLYYRGAALHYKHPPWTNKLSGTKVNHSSMRGPLHFVKDKQGQDIIGLLDKPSQNLLKHYVKQSRSLRQPLSTAVTN